MSAKAKRTAMQANISPLPNSNEDNNETTKFNSLNLLIDCQVNFVRTLNSINTINTFIPTLIADQTHLFQTLVKTLTEQFDLLTKSIETLKEKQSYFSIPTNSN